MPGTPSSAVLGWAFVLSFFALTFLECARPYLLSLVTGSVAIGIGFYWLKQTVVDFSGFPAWYGVVVYLLFVIFSAVQFLVFVYICRRLTTTLGKFALAAPFAWITAEFTTLRIFPWEVGHTQIAFTHFVQISDLAGSSGVTFLMFWCGEALLGGLRKEQRIHPWARVFPFVCFVLALGYGNFQIRQFAEGPDRSPANIAVIQANISVEEKHNVKYFLRNTERYAELSRSLTSDPDLIVWPESSITDPLPDNIANRGQLPGFDALLPPDRNLLVGAITYGSNETLFNSALAIERSGAIAPPYHKRILMPFGEYMPFEELVPSLRALNESVGDFTAGKSISVFDFALRNPSTVPLRVSPLICYEDIVPSLAREAVRDGATVLINLTNDAWFGRSKAPFQHHLIASFRAIENRRYLVRSTNSGLTAVVSPLGKTVSQIPIFSDGVMEIEVYPLSYQSHYSRYLGDSLWWIVVGIAGCFLLYGWFCRRSAGYKTE